MTVSLRTFQRSQIDRVQRAGRPILVGTVSIEKSELLSHLLTKRGIHHEVLNAKNHKREAEIVAQAGRMGAVTIATNMAGRGTDIVLGGNPETMAWARLQDKYPTRLDVPREEWDALVESIDKEHAMAEMGEKVKKMGGLHVIGSERHDARRIDLQLRGRCGRQGDPGSSRFFLSLDDDLMRIFAGPYVKRILEMGGFKDDVPIESKMVSRRIDGAQKKREEFNFEIRKNLLEYDEVMDEQRKRVYKFRQNILDGVSCRQIIHDMIREQVELNLNTCLEPHFGGESFARYAGTHLSVELDPKIFKNREIDEAVQIAKDEAERAAETDILGAIEENLPLAEEESEWNWEALAKFVNVRWGLSFRDKDLIKAGRDRVDEMLINKAREALQKVDISAGAPMLENDYGLRTAIAWVNAKFGFQVDLDTVKAFHSNQEIMDYISDLAIAKYIQKEAEYPVMAGMYQFAVASGGGAQPRIDREGLVSWASRRFESDLSIEDLKNKQRDEIRELLVAKSLDHQRIAKSAKETLLEKVSSLSQNGEVPLKNANGSATSLSQWFKSQLDYDLEIADVEQLDQEALEKKLDSIVEDHFHPEIRRMERVVLLEIVDSSWKDHLLAMDYLRSAVGSRGMAQLDPKVEYKREGMRMFEGLWRTIGERVTDLVFRMEQMNEGFVSNTLVETSARHDAAPAVHESDIAREQNEAIDRQGEVKIETIRNRKAKVGRNEPCPCGSGKKYKACCMRQREAKT